MNNVEKRAAERLVHVFQSMDAYTKGRLVGIGEGLALANLTAASADKDAMRVMLGMAPKESA